jgi:hypothetical protein
MRGEELGRNQIPKKRGGEPIKVPDKRDSPVDAFHMPALATNMNNM